MVQVAYPAEFPLGEIQDCIRIVTGKTILDEKELFAAAAWNVQGFGQRMLIGPPHAALPVQARANLTQLRSALMTVDVAGDAPQALPAWLMLVIQMLIKIISELGE